MADQGLDLAPLGLHLSRHGTGRLTHLPCENGKGYVPYVKNILKKLSVEAESNHGDVLDELYEQYAYIMTSLKVCLIYQVVQRQGNCWCHFNVPSTCLKEIQAELYRIKKAFDEAEPLYSEAMNILESSFSPDS